MSHRFAVVACALVCLAIAPAGASAASAPFTPGAAGIGDPYFPLDGNGGYDTDNYLLELRYDPASDVLQGVATIEAEATQKLSAFNLDLNGLNVRRITVDKRPATWTRNEDELTITPRSPIKDGKKFDVVVVYDGIPTPVGDAEIGLSGFIATDDGALVAGQPEVADHWYPVNDHPLDKASYEFRVTVPAGTEVIANGELKSNKTSRGLTTWIWRAKEPMASYLTTVDIGQFDIKAYRESGIRYWDALDPDLFDGPAPATGSRFAISQAANYSYKRLARTIAVPAGGGQLSFQVDRDTETNWDFFFVEARHVGQDDWTTLPDVNGHTGQARSGYRCDFYLSLHPFLAHYLTDPGGNVRCTPGGATGTWNVATGASNGYETWAVDLGAYAGSNVELAISYVSDDTIQHRGVVVDDIVGPGGAGSTSFENDGNTLDGWTVPGRPGGHRRPTRTTGRRAARPTCRASAASRAARWIASRRSSTSSRASGGAIRSAPPAGSSTTCRGSASPWRPRRGRSTRWTSSPSSAIRPTPSSSTSSPTSGSATTSRSRAGSTSGSTRASRRTRSGCGPRTRAAPPRRTTSTSTRRSRPTTSSGI